jgi:hypothetical protein
MDRERHVWIDGKKIVAVRPTTAFADLFVPGNRNHRRSRGNDGVE